MDRTGKEAPVNRWDWLPAFMPGVARLMAERRREHGNAWVNECWRRGVLQLEPGWFFARQGAVSVGTPWRCPEIQSFGELQLTPTQCLLVLRPKETRDGS